ncbi:MAG: DNA adenine methylase [Pyrinomonadaceae bacterium]|nr:DNA adenine methylase [Pyrinomonadaceae bacterium]MCX7639042.1 DNA adenine methylase [Pyrinomonadaceae bacterium]MDW8303737.1 DNA adenine methylase [Acidobacteriota bacterium]
MLIEVLLKPKPFVKWAGGKKQLLKLIKERAPYSYRRYIEPFVGGGALLFELLPKRAIVNDINEELINAYLAIRDNLYELIDSLKQHNNSEEYYYYMRSLKPNELNRIERASRFIYLNKTCYNGLYRENSKGEFNVPFGKYKNPKIVDEQNLRAVSYYLDSEDITIICSDYKEVCHMATSGDFVYLDPPYYPLNRSSSFTKYTRHDFTEKDHTELAYIFRELDRKGCKVLLSNSNAEFIKNLYKGYIIEEVEAIRAINCKGSGRKKSKLEIIVRNYYT